jgi:hypothetical protein
MTTTLVEQTKHSVTCIAKSSIEECNVIGWQTC